jgi:hypothetical protein
MYEAQPNFDRSQLYKSHKAVCGLLITGCDTAGVFEPLEEAFDAIAQSVESQIDWTLNLAVASSKKSHSPDRLHRRN